MQRNCCIDEQQWCASFQMHDLCVPRSAEHERGALGTGFVLGSAQHSCRNFAALQLQRQPPHEITRCASGELCRAACNHAAPLPVIQQHARWPAPSIVHRRGSVGGGVASCRPSRFSKFSECDNFALPFIFRQPFFLAPEFCGFREAPAGLPEFFFIFSSDSR